MHSPKQSTSRADSRLRKIEQFILEHLPVYRKTPHFREWLEWADASGFLVSVFPDEREETVLAAAIVRPISFEQLEAGYHSFVSDDKTDDFIFIDIAVAPGKLAMRALGLGFLARFGRRAGIAFHSKGKLKVHDHHTVKKALFKLK